MELLGNILTGIASLLHFGFLYLEMFLWRTPRGLKVFGFTQEFADLTHDLAKNQGLYNGFLGAGLFWGLVTGQFPVKAFFLACAVVAGVFGGVTVKRSILFFQALPAALALVFLALA